MRSQSVLISKIGSAQGRPSDFYPDGYRVFIDVECKDSREMLSLMEFARADNVWITDEEPKH
ncbi:MAG: hypothetical protein WC390_06395 [Sulfurimonas sp.]|jgi:hypothetical protein